MGKLTVLLPALVMLFSIGLWSLKVENMVKRIIHRHIVEKTEKIETVFFDPR